MLRSLVWLSLALAAWLASPIAHAHINLKYPMRRAGGNLKLESCGGAAKGASPTVLEPGATITVTWDETIQHPGHYRIAFDTDGEDFPSLTGYDDIKTSVPFDLGNGAVVLVDDIMDKTGPIFGSTPYEQQVTLPDVECETCTLQLIQVMIDKPPYTANGDDIYHECADIALRRAGGTPDAGAPPPVDAGAPMPMAGMVGPPPPSPMAGSVAPPTGGTMTAAGTGVTGGIGATGGTAAPLPLPTTMTGSSGDGGGCSAAGGRASGSMPREGGIAVALAVLALARRRRADTRGRTW
jgi:hypothetical protein